MLVRRIVAAAFGLALASPLCAVAQDQTPTERPRGINAREHRQIERLKDGRQSDELTRGELNRLRADEAASLEQAMRQLVDEPAVRESIAREGHRYWSAHHSLDAMVEDYRRLLPLAAARPAPQPTDLPAHFTDDYSAPTRAILERFRVSALF